MVLMQYSGFLREVTGEHKKGFGRIYRPVRRRIFSKEEIRNAESFCLRRLRRYEACVI